MSLAEEENDRSFWVGPASEWKVKYPGPKYRWCHSDLVNSEFQYNVGRCVHPHPECLYEFHDLSSDRQEMSLFWFLDGSKCLSIEGNGARLMRATVPDDATVYVHGDKLWFRASEFVLEDVGCSRCEIKSLIESGAMDRSWSQILDGRSRPAGAYHYRGCKNAGTDGSPEIPPDVIIPRLGWSSKQGDRSQG